MRRIQNRATTFLATAGYLLAVSASALFHDHHDDCHDDGPARSGFTASHECDSHDCSVCQFLAQKPAPVAEVTTVHGAPLVQNISAPFSLRVQVDVFSAWRSRAPPAAA
jgi:hypothetical protein